jgi:ubiquinone/menaquinone biosynthesis C-methylase UbiE
MTNAAAARFCQDYEDYNKSLRIPHPYFQRIQYVKVNLMIIDMVLKRKHDRILDIGSGTGHLILGLSAVSRGCVALDIKLESLGYIHGKNPDVDCISSDVHLGLPFKRDSFDVVIASELLEHLNEPKRFFEEVRRVLKRNGILILTTPNSDNLTYKIFRLCPRPMAVSLAKRAGVDMKLHPELSGEEDLDRTDPHLHKVEGFTLDELQNLGRENGFKTTFVLSFSLPVPDRVFSYLPKHLTSFIVNHVEDHIPYALRHLIVYENK